MSVTDIFWVVFGLILYTYFGYPILLSLLTAGRRQPAYPADQDLPTISLVVTAFNEESVLRGKLENSFALDYPQDRLQVIVVSDGSTDGTDDVARDFRCGCVPDSKPLDYVHAVNHQPKYRET